MDVMPRLESLFTNYLEQAETLKSDKNKFASVLGWGCSAAIAAPATRT